MITSLDLSFEKPNMVDETEWPPGVHGKSRFWTYFSQKPSLTVQACVRTPGAHTGWTPCGSLLGPSVTHT